MAEPILSCAAAHPDTFRCLRRLVIDDWLRDGDVGGHALLVGRAGSGKTVFAAQLCRELRLDGRLLAAHFFCSSSPSAQNGLRSAIVSISAQCTANVPAFSSLLPDNACELRGSATDEQLLRQLLLSPLDALPPPESEDCRNVVVLDGLDEIRAADHAEMTRLFAILAGCAPPWLRILMTSRDGVEFELPSVRRLLHDVADEDLRPLLLEGLAKRVSRLEREMTLKALLKNAQCSMLYGGLMRERLLPRADDNRVLSKRQITQQCPPGLNSFLKHQLEDAHRELPQRADEFLELVCALRSPICVSALESVTTEPRLLAAETLSSFVVVEADKVFVRHRVIGEWLRARGFGAASGSAILASKCCEWTDDIINDGDRPSGISSGQRSYGVAHLLEHLLEYEEPDAAEKIARTLCSVRYMQERLALPEATLADLIDDYDRCEERVGKVSGAKLQINTCKNFLQDRFQVLHQQPQFLLQVAANYAAAQRLQQNARVELAETPWIEDLTALPESRGCQQRIAGDIRAFDVSPDGRTVAVLMRPTKGAAAAGSGASRNSLSLSLLHADSGAVKYEPILLQQVVPDVSGTIARYLPDGNLFVGSQSVLLDAAGRPVASGLEFSAVELKDKFAIECCDANEKLLALGVNTMPRGGRSLNVIVFDLKSRRMLRTLELFNGSRRSCHSVRAVQLSRSSDRTLLCTLARVEDGVLKVRVYSTGKWKIVNSTDVACPSLGACVLTGDTLLLAGTLRSAGRSHSSPVRSHLWTHRSVSNKTVFEWRCWEDHAVAAQRKDTIAVVRWRGPEARVELWTAGRSLEVAPDACYALRGVSNSCELRLAHDDTLVFASLDDVRVFRLADLDAVDGAWDDDADAPSAVTDVRADSLRFLPGSETAVLVSSRPHHDQRLFSVFLCRLDSDDDHGHSVAPTPFRNESRRHTSGSPHAPAHEARVGAPETVGGVCFPSADGDFLVFNSGNCLKVWRVGSAEAARVLTIHQSGGGAGGDSVDVVACSSTQDSLVAAQVIQDPNGVFVADLRSMAVLGRIEVAPDLALHITLLTFANFGPLVVYAGGELSLWRPRERALEWRKRLQRLEYLSSSRSVARLAVSVVDHRDQRGCLLLCSGDDEHFQVRLDLGTSDKSWLPSRAHSDACFSADGTLLIGLCSPTDVSCVWSAASGDLLSHFELQRHSPGQVLGMLTNAHLLIRHHKSLFVIDLASGRPVASLHVERRLERKWSARGLRISPLGGMLLGATVHRQVILYRCHNFRLVRCKTALQVVGR